MIQLDDLCDDIWYVMVDYLTVEDWKTLTYVSKGVQHRALCQWLHMARLHIDPHVKVLSASHFWRLYTGDTLFPDSVYTQFQLQNNPWAQAWLQRTFVYPGSDVIDETPHDMIKSLMYDMSCANHLKMICPGPSPTNMDTRIGFYYRTNDYLNRADRKRQELERYVRRVYPEFAILH